MRKKLFISTIIIALITVSLSMLSVNFVFRQQFSDYLTQTNELTLEQLPSRLSTLYLSKGSWDSASLEELVNTLPAGTIVTLTDPKGKLITSLTNSMAEMMQGQGSSMMSMMGSSPIMSYKTKTIPISGPKGLIATAIVRYPATPQILNPQDVQFQSSIFHSLLAAGGLALLLGMLLSYFMSLRLVSPLLSLTQAAKRIGQGHLQERVTTRSHDEIGLLASAFNTMADNLQRQETLRKQFTADIAHELRTPLTSIKSYIEAFQDDILPANPENLSSIHEEIDRLVDLSSDLKDLNVAEMGALNIKPESIDYKRLLEKILHNLNPLFQEKGLTVAFNAPEEPLYSLGDEHLLTRLFFNLIHNAYRYSNHGGWINVKLTTTNQAIDIRIRNSGEGIPEEDLPFIFERFYRADKSRARETGGTGIGLALVRQIVNLHQGTISVQSKVGQDTEFRIELPKNREVTAN